MPQPKQKKEHLIRSEVVNIQMIYSPKHHKHVLESQEKRQWVQLERIVSLKYL